MTNKYQGSDFELRVDGMIAHMKIQVENPALLNSKLIFDEVLYLDTNFHQLNLTRGNSYLPLPDWIEKKKAITNPQNNDEECFKWAVIAALEWSEIKSHPERVSNFRKFVDNYDWSGLKFPVANKDIKVFQMNNDITINVSSVENFDIHIRRKEIRREVIGTFGPPLCGNPTLRGDRKINLLMISEGGIRHYTTIKSLSRLLTSRNSKHHGKQHFCMNCLHGFTLESSRDEHYA